MTKVKRKEENSLYPIWAKIFASSTYSWEEAAGPRFWPIESLIPVTSGGVRLAAILIHWLAACGEQARLQAPAQICHWQGRRSEAGRARAGSRQERGELRQGEQERGGAGAHRTGGEKQRGRRALQRRRREAARPRQARARGEKGRSEAGRGEERRSEAGRAHAGGEKRARAGEDEARCAEEARRRVACGRAGARGSGPATQQAAKQARSSEAVRLARVLLQSEKKQRLQTAEQVMVNT